MKTKLLFSFLLTLLLSGCATMAPPAASHKMPWLQRKAQLTQIHSWQLEGQVGASDNQHAWSASLQWHQKKNNYQIYLAGPLGVDATLITGKPGAVKLQQAGKTYHAISPDNLMAQLLGTPFPVDDIFYWARGIPNPVYPSQKTFDQYNHLKQLKQQGWTINFLAYTTMGGVDLPSKVFMRQGKLSVRVVVTKWKVPSPQSSLLGHQRKSENSVEQTSASAKHQPQTLSSKQSSTEEREPRSED